MVQVTEDSRQLMVAGLLAGVDGGFGQIDRLGRVDSRCINSGGGECQAERTGDVDSCACGDMGENRNETEDTENKRVSLLMLEYGWKLLILLDSLSARAILGQAPCSMSLRLMRLN
jgi:hypothetical protein